MPIGMKIKSQTSELCHAHVTIMDACDLYPPWAIYFELKNSGVAADGTCALERNTEQQQHTKSAKKL